MAIVIVFYIHNIHTNEDNLLSKYLGLGFIAGFLNIVIAKGSVSNKILFYDLYSNKILLKTEASNDSYYLSKNLFFAYFTLNIISQYFAS